MAVATSTAMAPSNVVNLSGQKGLCFIASIPIKTPMRHSNSLILRLCSLTINSKKPLLSFHTTGWNFAINTGAKCANEVEPQKHALIAVKVVDLEANEDKNVQELLENNWPRVSRKERYPKYLSRSACQRVTLDYFQILKYPLVTELAMKEMLEKNTLVFVVDKHADKKNIKEAFKKMLRVQIKKVNTLIMPDGNKKAYLMLAPNFNALEVAKRLEVV